VRLGNLKSRPHPQQIPGKQTSAPMAPSRPRILRAQAGRRLEAIIAKITP